MDALLVTHGCAELKRALRHGAALSPAGGSPPGATVLIPARQCPVNAVEEWQEHCGTVYSVAWVLYQQAQLHDAAEFQQTILEDNHRCNRCRGQASPVHRFSYGRQT